MPGDLIGYDPERIRTLTDKTAAAIADLEGTPLDDPAAAESRRAVRAVSFALSTQWMPVLARIGGDTSMTSWETDGPAAIGAGGGGLRATSGEPPTTLEELLEIVDAAERGEWEAVVALAAALADDDELPVAFLAELGPEGVLELLHGLAYSGVELAHPSATDSERQELAERLRDGLGLVGSEHGFGDAAFAGAMLDLVDDVGGGRAMFVFAFLGEGDVDVAAPAAIVGLRLVDQERDGDIEYNDQRGLPPGFAMLMLGDPGAVESGDVLEVVLRLASTDPEAARGLLGDSETMHHLVTRSWHDGGSALVIAAAAAITGADLRDPESPPDADTIDTVNQIVSQTVNGLGGSEHHEPRRLTEEASVAAADIVGVHAAAFDNAVQNANWQDPVTDEQLREGATTTHTERAFGADYAVGVAYLGHDEAGRFIQGAGSSTAGQDRLAIGVGTYQAQLAAGAAAQVAADPPWGQGRLDEHLRQSAEFEGSVASHVGRGAQQAGRDADQAMTGFVGAVAFGAKQIPLVGDAVGVIDTGAGWAMGYGGDLSSGIAGEFAQSEAAAIAWAEDYSRTALTGLQVIYVNAFVAAGVIELPPLDDAYLYESPDGIMLIDPVALADESGPETHLGNWLKNNATLIAGDGGELEFRSSAFDDGFEAAQSDTYLPRGA